MTLADKAFPVANRKLRDDISVERFLKGCRDKAAVYEIRHQRPETLGDAVRAVKLEAENRLFLGTLLL